LFSLGHSLATHLPPLASWRCQLDKRGGAIDDKIKKLDEELMRHKELIARARPGPAQARGLAVGADVQTAPSLRRRPSSSATCHPHQEAAKQRALRVLKQKKLCAWGAAFGLVLCLLPIHSPLTLCRCGCFRYEGQRDQLYQQQFNVEQTNFALASVQDTKVQVGEASRLGGVVCRLLHTTHSSSL
jgi:charged multivesicular body protein 5